MGKGRRWISWSLSSNTFPYTPDNVTTGYDDWPKYPIETLIEGGDCEDTSILMAALLDQMGYDVIILKCPGHVAVGVWCEGCYGTYFRFRGRRYFYLETTAPGWGVGQIPREYKNVKCYLEPWKHGGARLRTYV